MTNGMAYRRITPKLTSKRMIAYNPPMKTKFLAPVKTFWSEHKNTLPSRAMQSSLDGALKRRVLLSNTSYDVIEALYMTKRGSKGSANAMDINYDL